MPNLVHLLVDKDGFRLRGNDVSRIEAFSDAVFGFAVTLLVVSLEVPKTYGELQEMLRGFIPFAICFWFLFAVWLEHYRFNRRFGLEDMGTLRVNAVLLFVVLFYVYPLKFLFTVALGMSHRVVFSAPWQLRNLMVLYGVGFCAVYGLIALLNYQGWRHRKELELNAVELVLTRSYITEAAMAAGIGLLSCVVAYVLPQGDAGSAGWTYLLLAVFRPILGIRADRRVKRMQAASTYADAAE